MYPWVDTMLSVGNLRAIRRIDSTDPQLISEANDYALVELISPFTHWLDIELYEPQV